MSSPAARFYDDGLVYAKHADIQPGQSDVYLGWLIIEPLRADVFGLEGLTEEEAAALGRMVRRLAGALKAVLDAEHVYLFVMGHHQPTLHVHLVPRYPGAPREYWGMRVDEWPEAPRGGPQEAASVCARLRDYLISER